MAIAIVAKHCMELDIPEISKLKKVFSPKILIHGIPWKIKVERTEEDKVYSLNAFLLCANKDKSPNWSLSGTASFKLLPFSDDGKPIDFGAEPFVFDASGVAYGPRDFIKWDDLFNEGKKYVKNDTIKLEIKVTAENPNEPNRSRLNFECIQKCCDNSYSATYQLTVANVLNLMAVQSPRFTLHGLHWTIQINKLPSSQLGVLLLLNENSEKLPCKASMTIKLVSSKKDVDPIEKFDTKQYQYLKNLVSVTVVSWDEMIKPKNGYVTNDSITLEVKIEVNDPEGDATIAKRVKLNLQNETKSPQMECPICFKCIANQELAVTPCGHMFCFECIKEAVTGRAVCPSCNKAVQSNALRQIYLPV